VNWQRAAHVPATVETARPAVAQVKSEGSAAAEFFCATHAASQFGPKPERTQTLELDEKTHLRIGIDAFDVAQCGQGEVEQRARITRGTALGRKPPQQLHQIAAEGEARRISPQCQERRDQLRASDIRHSPMAQLQLDVQMVHQIQGSGKALDTFARALRHGGHAAAIRGQEMNDAIRFSDFHRAQQNGFGLVNGQWSQGSGTGALARRISSALGDSSGAGCSG